MKYMLLFCGSEEEVPAELDRELYRKAEEWFERHGKAGRILEGYELQPSRTAKTVRLRGGRPAVLDGPFVEAKEMVGGYAIVEVPDEATVVEMAREWNAIWAAIPSPTGSHGVVEIRPLMQRGS